MAFFALFTHFQKASFRVFLTIFSHFKSCPLPLYTPRLSITQFSAFTDSRFIRNMPISALSALIWRILIRAQMTPFEKTTKHSETHNTPCSGYRAIN
jgi:hypothetical protein